MTSTSGTLRDVLARLLRDRVLSFPRSDGSIVLRERRAGMEVSITGAPESLVAVHVGTLGHLSMLKVGDWNRRCDYLLIAQYEDAVLACFVELKTTMTEELDAREQLRRSLPIWEYLRSACEVDCEGNIGWPSRFTVTYSLLPSRQSDRLDKQPVRRAPSDWPEEEPYKGITVRKFVGDRFTFSRLV